jgi:hypothetical protein
MDGPMPMPAQWAAVDDMVEQYTAMLSQQEWTTADIALDLASGQASEKRVLAMIAATALQRLAHQS